MGFLSKVFGSDPGDSDACAGGTFTCESCGDEIDSSTVDNIWDLCNDSYENGDSGTKYCCGMIYQEGESVCASCGDPL
jgi:hypothetical protein